MFLFYFVKVSLPLRQSDTGVRVRFELLSSSRRLCEKQNCYRSADAFHVIQMSAFFEYCSSSTGCANAFRLSRQPRTEGCKGLPFVDFFCIRSNFRRHPLRKRNFTAHVTPR